MTESTATAQNEQKVQKLHKAFRLSGSSEQVRDAKNKLIAAIAEYEALVQLVRVPEGTSGSGHFTHVWRVGKEMVDSAHNDVLRVVRDYNDVRKADVPNA